MFAEYMDTAKLVMLALILSCFVLTLWIKKNHYKKMMGIRNEHIAVLEKANASLTLNNMELNAHILELVKTVREGSEAIRIIHKRLEQHRTRR